MAALRLAGAGRDDLVGRVVAVLLGVEPAPALVAEIRSLLPAEPKLGAPEGPPRPADSFRLVDPLSKTEIRVLRYLPTNLSVPEIARELSISVHTVRTHVRHLFAKLGAHGRTEAVDRARALGLLAPSPSRRAS